MMLEARNVQKYYSNGKERLHVLKDISVSVKEGEIAAIVGPSGAGKSTLLHILGGLDRPTSGKIFFEGKPLEDLSDRELAFMRNAAVGFVFQFYHLMPEFNVLENVTMPAIISRRPQAKGPSSKEKAVGLLEMVGLGGRMRHLPSQLSGGEQQRVAIARSLINSPKLLLCDEPTGNLDSENGRQICQLLKNLNREKATTIVMVTHNLDVAAIASRVYNIVDGRLAN